MIPESQLGKTSIGKKAPAKNSKKIMPKSHRVAHISSVQKAVIAKDMLRKKYKKTARVTADKKSTTEPKLVGR